MLLSSTAKPPEMDRAGWLYRQPNCFQTWQRIRHLVKRYLTDTHLCDRLEDLPIQFHHPQPRPWQPIDWHSIGPDQIVGIDLKVFLSIVTGAMDTEAPIRGYTQTSRQYLEPLHPLMARFVGGTVDENGRLLEPGLWEKEERQHSPVLGKLYSQLTGEKAVAHIRTPRAYQPSSTPYDDLYRHGLHRVATEYSAVCLYLWLMAHTTGTVQHLFEELLFDEINHMTKFWGFGLWAYPDGWLARLQQVILQPVLFWTDQRSSSASYLGAIADFMRTLHCMMGTLNWDAWSPAHRIELMFTFIAVMRRLWQWNSHLTPDYLRELFGSPPSQN